VRLLAGNLLATLGWGLLGTVLALYAVVAVVAGTTLFTRRDVAT
jgi:protein-S-isoprenylcysteine O-methyltransferase Ste14